MPKLIEIMGPPGSGKSFISSELELVKENKEKVFFHSGNYNHDYNLSLFSKIFIRLKIIFKIAIFYLIFYKRIFLKKNYKGNFFFKVVFLFYEHQVYIEILKKTLAHDKYLIMEPGPIMYFIQDYFYINDKISNYEIKIYNKFFLHTDYIINLNCNTDLLIDRLKTRTRGLPLRMRKLNDNKIEPTIKRSKDLLNNYFNNFNNLNTKIINIDTSNNISTIKDQILNFLK